MVKFQTEQPLRTISAYAAMQPCLWFILPQETIRTTLVWAGAWGHIDVQGLCRTDPTSHWLQHSGEPASPITDSGTQESSPAPLLDSKVELALVEGEWVSQPKGR